MTSAFNIAEFFIGTVDEEHGGAITHLKLQKLLYYAQGFHLATQGQPLFPEEIQAWPDGPVVPAVYEQFKKYKNQAIPPGSLDSPIDQPPEVREILDAIQVNYGIYDAPVLMRMTHTESPWMEAAARGSGSVIATDSLREYFHRVVTAAQGGTSYNGEPRWPIESFQHQRRAQILGRLDRHRDQMRTRFGPISPSHPWALDGVESAEEFPLWSAEIITS